MFIGRLRGFREGWLGGQLGLFVPLKWLSSRIISDVQGTTMIFLN